MAQAQNFAKFFKNLDFSEICAHARHYHGATASEILGISWIYDHTGKTVGQLASALRREYGKNVVQSIFYEETSPDPLEVLEAAEEARRAEAEAAAELLLGEADSARLAARLGVTRRRAQQKIAARRRALLAAAAGEGQLELALAEAGTGVRP
jgi:hypothetical protein